MIRSFILAALAVILFIAGIVFKFEGDIWCIPCFILAFFSVIASYFVFESWSDDRAFWSVVKTY